jgi:hypothetical protein
MGRGYSGLAYSKRAELVRKSAIEHHASRSAEITGDECDLSRLPVGAKFVRKWHPHFGVYAVVARKNGSISTEVATGSGDRGELPHWTRVIPVTEGV